MSQSRQSKYTPFGILGRKVGMTQVFGPNREVIPVTAIEVGPCPVIQKKTKSSDGYNAIQIGFIPKKKQNATKPEQGHFKASGAAVTRHVTEVRLDDKTIENYSVGQVLDANLFQVGDHIDVAGQSKGRGFTGVIKRHNFHMVDATHNHEFFRHGGSIGCREWPGKVFKNKKMAGHYGAERVSVQNLEVVGVEADKNLILVRGSVPGARNGYLEIKASVKGGFAPRNFAAKESTETAEAPAAQ